MQRFTLSGNFSRSERSVRQTWVALRQPVSPPHAPTQKDSSPRPHLRPAKSLACPHLRPRGCADQSQSHQARERHIPAPSSRLRRAQKYQSPARSADTKTCSCSPPHPKLPHSPGETSQSLCARPPTPPSKASSPPLLR